MTQDDSEDGSALRELLDGPAFQSDPHRLLRHLPVSLEPR
jgi:hypothetical protein